MKYYCNRYFKTHIDFETKIEKYKYELKSQTISSNHKSQADREIKPKP